MKEIPSIWRTELLHPLSVHFPIALLSFAAVIGIAYLIFRNRAFSPFLRFSLSLLLWAGVVLFWIAFYTGQEAYSIVVRTICDPGVLKNHLYWAYVSGYLFSAAMAADIIRLFIKTRLRIWPTLLVILLVVAGTGSISYAGHLGASVVYQQAGGVFVPSENCSEYD